MSFSKKNTHKWGMDVKFSLFYVAWESWQTAHYLFTEEVADAPASGRSMAGANFGHENNTKVSLAGALHKWPEH